MNLSPAESSELEMSVGVDGARAIQSRERTFEGRVVAGVVGIMSGSQPAESGDACES